MDAGAAVSQTRRGYWVSQLRVIYDREEAASSAIQEVRDRAATASEELEAPIDTVALSQAADFSPSRTVLFLFVEFESAVREAADELFHYQTNVTAEQAVRDASNLAQIPRPLLEAVSAIRRSRNAILHERALTNVPADAAFRTLSQFLQSLPDWS